MLAGLKCYSIIVNTSWPIKIITPKGIPLQVYMIILAALRSPDTLSADKLKTWWCNSCSNFAMMFCSVMPGHEVIFQGKFFLNEL